MTDNNEKIVSVIYHSPSQKNSEFDLFLSNLEYLLRDISKCKPIVSVIASDFNARSSSWWSEDINTSEVTKLYSLTSAKGFLQIINEPTHIQTNSSSCIDSVFTDQTNLSVNSGVHYSLHLNSLIPPNHHYTSVLYGLKKRQILKKLGNSVNWETLFNKKVIDAQVAVFTETILNVFRNYVPNKYVTIDDKDPVWMNETIKLLKIKAKKQYVQ